MTGVLEPATTPPSGVADLATLMWASLFTGVVVVLVEQLGLVVHPGPVKIAVLRTWPVASSALAVTEKVSV